MNPAELKRKLQASLDYLKGELGNIRTGRVTPSLLDDVRVNAYGSAMTVKEVGSINVLDPQTLSVAPWDKSLLESIEKGIRESELNLNPVVQGESVIIPIPQLTEDRRKEFTRIVSTKVEDVKTTMRSIRQDAMKEIEAGFTAKEFGEDEKFTLKDDVEEIIKDFVKQAEDSGEVKKSEIMHIGS
jgi:ribosome recycling factor